MYATVVFLAVLAFYFSWRHHYEIKSYYVLLEAEEGHLERREPIGPQSFWMPLCTGVLLAATARLVTFGNSFMGTALPLAMLVLAFLGSITWYRLSKEFVELWKIRILQNETGDLFPIVPEGFFDKKDEKK